MSDVAGTLTGPLSVAGLRARAGARRELPGADVHPLGPTRMCSEELFVDALVRERRCADRFGQAFAVLLLELHPFADKDASAVWPVVVESVAQAKRDTDVLGWYESGAVLGLILHDIAQVDGSVVSKFEERVRRLLARDLDATTLDAVSMRRYEHPPNSSGVAGSSRIDPLLEMLPVDRMTRGQRLAKRTLDVVGSFAALLVLTPVIAIIAALVKMKSRGPVFYRQTRIGHGGQPFTMLKFRSMYVDAGHAIHQDYVTSFIKAGGQKKQDGEVFKIQNDPRVTPIGDFLRRTSLDELPQFWNVLVGDMSLVGPRPPLPFEVEQYQPWHRRRVLDSMPGVTGLWQVTGRSRTTFDEMVRLDLRYARSYSVWNDIKILAATPRAVISGKGAC